MNGEFKAGQKIKSRDIKKMMDRGVKRVPVYKDRIKHEPFLTPAGIAAKAQSTEDWIARLAHNRIKKVLEEGTTQGWESDVSGTKHPLPQFVTGQF